VGPVEEEFSFKKMNLTFKRKPNVFCPKGGVLELEYFKIKYGFEGFEERNNFLHKNFFKFKVNFE
jgi:hypothetical protein